MVPSTRLPSFKSEAMSQVATFSAAAAWVGNPVKDAIYLNVTPPKNDGKTIYKLDVKDVPIDGFWSINAKGYLEPNPYNAYSLNNLTAKKGEDASWRTALVTQTRIDAHAGSLFESGGDACGSVACLEEGDPGAERCTP
jgi:hypothetical protein